LPNEPEPPASTAAVPADSAKRTGAARLNLRRLIRFCQTNRSRTPARAPILTPLQDKLLLSACYLALGVAHALPWWMVALVFGRDIFILAMAAYGYLFTTLREFPPSVWGKLSTFVQIFAAMVLVAERAGLDIDEATSHLHDLVPG